MKTTRTAGIVLVVAAVLLTALMARPTEDVRRALYISPNVTRVNVTDDQVLELLQRTRWPDELWMFSLRVDGNGSLRPGNHSDFVRRVHRLRPPTQVLTAFGFDARAYPLNDFVRATTLHNTIVQFVTAHEYDGVVLDFEPVRADDQAFLSFIRNLKAALPGKRVGTYGFRIIEKGNQWNWDADALAHVANTSDFVQLALYNTRTLAQAPDGTYTAASYQRWLQNQTATVDRLGIDHKIYWGLPAYGGSGAHIVAIENIGVAGPYFYDRNTAIYSEAYMTEADYALYDAFLTKTLPPPQGGPQ